MMKFVVFVVGICFTIMLFDNCNFRSKSAEQKYIGTYLFDSSNSILNGYKNIDFKKCKLKITSDHRFCFENNLPIFSFSKGTWKIVFFDTFDCLELLADDSTQSYEQMCWNGGARFSFCYPVPTAGNNQVELVSFSKLSN